jgi:hypothetical protein
VSPDNNLSLSKLTNGQFREWISDSKLFLITLNENMKTYETESKDLSYIEAPPSPDSALPKIFKVNATILHEDKIVVAGLDATGKGLANIFMYT